jgi:hypothetical protein
MSVDARILLADAAEKANDGREIKRRDSVDKTSGRSAKRRRESAAELQTMQEAIESAKTGGFEPITGNDKVIRRLWGKSLSSPNLDRFTQTLSKLSMPFLRQFLSDGLLEGCAHSINRVMGDRSRSTSALSRTFHVTAEDVLDFNLMRWLFQAHNVTIEQGFLPDYRRTTFRDFEYPLGKNKFKFILSAIRTKNVWKFVESEFVKICAQRWSNPMCASVDELIEAYNINEARTIFMERKPHSCGFLVYVMTVIGSRTGLPYTWAATFHEEFPLTSPVVSYGKLVQKAVAYNAAHPAPGAGALIVTADSAFGGYQTVVHASEIGFYAINAMRADSLAKLHEVMFYDLEKGDSRSVAMILDGVADERFKKIIVTAFRDEGDFFTVSNAFDLARVDLSASSASILGLPDSLAPESAPVDALVPSEAGGASDASSAGDSAELAPTLDLVNATQEDYDAGFAIGSKLHVEYDDGEGGLEYFEGEVLANIGNEYRVKFFWGEEVVTDKVRMRVDHKVPKGSNDTEFGDISKIVSRRTTLPATGELFACADLTTAKSLAQLPVRFIQRMAQSDGRNTGGLGSSSLQMVSSLTGFLPEDLVPTKKKDAAKKYEDLSGKVLDAKLKGAGAPGPARRWSFTNTLTWRRTEPVSSHTLR